MVADAIPVEVRAIQLRGRQRLDRVVNGTAEPARESGETRLREAAGLPQQSSARITEPSPQRPAGRPAPACLPAGPPAGPRPSPRTTTLLLCVLPTCAASISSSSHVLGTSSCWLANTSLRVEKGGAGKEPSAFVHDGGAQQRMLQSSASTWRPPQAAAAPPSTCTPIRNRPTHDPAPALYTPHARIPARTLVPAVREHEGRRVHHQQPLTQRR